MTRPILSKTNLWSKFIAWETAVHLGDLTSVIGLLISLAGFAITIFGVFSSRNVARRAEEAARAAVRRIRVFDEMMDFTFAIVTLDEIKRFHRIGQWPLLPDRYAALRRTLVAITSSSMELTEAQRQTVQSTLATLRSIERTVERGMADPSRLDGAKFNNLLSERADGLTATLNELKMLHTDVRDGKA